MRQVCSQLCHQTGQQPATKHARFLENYCLVLKAAMLALATKTPSHSQLRQPTHNYLNLDCALQDQMATAYRNLETVFEYLKHIQVSDISFEYLKHIRVSDIYPWSI